MACPWQPDPVRPLLLAPLLLFLAACGRGAQAPEATAPSPAPPPDPPGARRDLVEALRADLEARRGPADGVGRAWLVPEESGPDPVPAGGVGRWTFLFEAGPPGIAPGGHLVFQAPPFWGWSTPQVEDPELPGYTEVTALAGGVALEAATTDRQQLTVTVGGGRRLRPGERIRIVYGAGPARARADRYAEAASRFWFRVDGDGDGVSGLLADAPAVRVVAGPPARAVLTVPTTVRPGTPFRAVLAILDAAGNAGVRVAGPVQVETPAALDAPAALDLEEDAGGVLSFPVTAREEGVYWLRASAPGGLEARSNPVAVQEGGGRILWGDLQTHSSWSDGTGEPADLYRYARDVAALDFCAVTDHDHWGMRPLERDPAAWRQALATAAAIHEPGRFVTVPGFEWTNWIHGHRHVLFFDPGRAVLLSSLDPATDTPAELWQALAGRPGVLTVAHHSAGGPVPVDWSFRPPPELEPVTEVVSVHGSSEAVDSPWPIAGGRPGNYVRDILGRGFRLGFVGSGDGHDGHPGLAHLAGRSGGLAAVLAEEVTRPAILAALRARHCYATSGPRILLRTSLAGRRMGSALAGPVTEAPLVAFAAGTAPLSALELVRSGRIVETVLGGGGKTLSMRTVLRDLTQGEFVYVRAVQEDRHFAVSSPFFVE